MLTLPISAKQQLEYLRMIASQKTPSLPLSEMTEKGGTPETGILAGDFEKYARDIYEAKQDIKQSEAIINDRETKIKEAMMQATKANIGKYTVTWPMRSYKAAEERVVPAKEAYSVRQSSLTIKENKDL